MSTRLVHGGRTSLLPAKFLFVTSPSIYVVYKIRLYKQNESQSIHEIRKKFYPMKISRYTVSPNPRTVPCLIPSQTGEQCSLTGSTTNQPTRGTTRGNSQNCACSESTVCALIFAGFNVRGFHGLAAIREYFVREYLNVTVNEHAHCYSQSMTSRVAKMATSLCSVAAPCNFTEYGPALPQEERTDARDRARYMADCFSASLHCNYERIFSVAPFAGATKPISNERRSYLLVDVKSSDVALHSIQ